MSSSASDVITYIGVPLAVLGVLPILYNTAVTLGALSNIRRMLRHARLTALTRSDVVNRVIEVELPRFAVTPWDRFTDRSEYWTLSRHPSLIPGGSWTIFNWRTNTIGFKTQRVEYSDQLRQPQAEIAFDELICYLLDLGAVPEPSGWRMLRNSGLWTPLGCCLMLSPDGQEKALTIASLDDSDGRLSVTIAWSASWTTRDYTNLPPYWVRLPPPPSQEDTPAAEGSDDVSAGDQLLSYEAGETSSIRKGPLDDATHDGLASPDRHITCQISMDGVATALTQVDRRQGSDRLDSFNIDHIRIRPGRSDGVWFASAATAFGTSSQTVLWNYKIPDDIVAFARRETVPCGVLVLLEVVDMSATPEWTCTNSPDQSARLDLQLRRVREQQDAARAEMQLPPAEREAATHARMRRENMTRLQDMRDNMRLEIQRKETRKVEAFQSPKWDNKVVAEHQFAWLKNRNLVPESACLKEAAGILLHRMVLDAEFCSSICKMLDLWKAWAENGGMRKSDYDTVQDGLALFAQATLLVAVIKDTSSALVGTLSMDLQECLHMWKMVRLG